MTNEQLLNLDNWKKKNKPRKAVYAYRAEINNLKYDGFSIEDIKKYLLETYSLSTSQRTLTRIVNQNVGVTSNQEETEIEGAQKELSKEETKIEGAHTEPLKDEVNPFFLEKMNKDIK